MSRTVRGSTIKSKVVDYVETRKGEILCNACMRIVPAQINLNNDSCPFCHQNVDKHLSNDFAFDDTDSDDIAVQC